MLILTLQSELCFSHRGGWKPVPACIAHHIYYQFPVTRGHCSTSSRCVNMANFRTDRGNKATDLNGSDHLYVHCVSKERLELLAQGMSCVELECCHVSFVDSLDIRRIIALCWSVVNGVKVKEMFAECNSLH